MPKAVPMFLSKFLIAEPELASSALKLPRFLPLTPQILLTPHQSNKIQNSPALLGNILPRPVTREDVVIDYVEEVRKSSAAVGADEIGGIDGNVKQRCDGSVYCGQALSRFGYEVRLVVVKVRVSRGLVSHDEGRCRVHSAVEVTGKGVFGMQVYPVVIVP